MLQNKLVYVLIYQLGEYLFSDDGLIQKQLPPNSDIDSFIEVIVVLYGERLKINQEQIPQCFWPLTGKWRMRGRANPNHLLSLLMTRLDLHKIYIDDESYHSGHAHAYEFYGVHPEKGATAIIRPDNCEYFLKKIKKAFLHTESRQMFQWFLM